MKSFFGGLAMALMVSGCAMQSSTVSDHTSPSDKVALKSGIIHANMDKSVNPGDDFFAYVNGTWVKNNEIPADKSSIGTFMILREKSIEQVKAIIEESSKGSFKSGSDEQKVGDLFNSYMDTAKREQLGVTPLASEFKAIDAITDTKALAAYFGHASKVGIAAPVALSQFPDLKNSSRYMIYVYQAGLGLPDKAYYLKEDKKSGDIRKKYQAHIERTLRLAGVSDAKKQASAVFALETRIAKLHLDKEKARDFAARYNAFNVKQLPELMPNFDWDSYLSVSGLSDIDTVVVMMVDYVKQLDKVITSTPLSVWRSYLKWQTTRSFSSYLNQALVDASFDFYGKTLSGVEQQRALWRRGVGVVNDVLGEVVGKVYVKHHFSPEAKAKMETLVANLIKAYGKSIKALDWMSAATKEEALDKLSKFTPKIGYPDEWKDYSGLAIQSDDLVGNLIRARLYGHKRAVERQKKPVDRKEWGMTPQTVNAYYNPTINEIVFPAAILQPPFFDLNADDAVNYGAIGAVIGHEIGHGFDDKGSTFDGNGVLRNWWTADDRKEFEKRTSKLVEQYNGYAVFDDLHVNGEFTLGENIGDLGGLSIALKAYKLSLGDKEAPVLDGYTGIQRVFIGYGQAWLSKMRDESLRHLIATDPHSPPYFRVNGIVKNVPEFYDAFDVTKENKLYLPEDERVKIW